MSLKNYNKESKSLHFNSISSYSLKDRFLIHLIDLGLYLFISILGKTIRFRTHKSNSDNGWEYMKQFTADKPLCIAVFWHDRIMLTSYFWRFSNYAAMVSESFDGEYISRVSQRFGHGIARGSSTRSGTKALRILKTLLEKEQFSLTLTIDGPKGPRYEVKSGAILLAKITGVPIVPILVQPKKYWTVRSWDKLQIPKPFTKAKVFVSKPIYISASAKKQDIENLRKEVQRKLDELVLLGEQWRNNKL